MDQDSIDWIEVLLEENAPQLLEDSTVEEISDEDVVWTRKVITQINVITEQLEHYRMLIYCKKINYVM